MTTNPESTLESHWTAIDPGPLWARYDEWVARIAANHGGSHHRVNDQVSFTRLAKPLAQCRMALVTTAGAHLDDHEPFDVANPGGDPSFRLIPHDVPDSRMRFSHTHYDTASAEVDPNVVLPRVALDAAVASGRIGSAAPMHIGLMGFNPDPRAIADETGPAVAAFLHEQEVDIALLVPG